jgi:hypothetical protein
MADGTAPTVQLSGGGVASLVFDRLHLSKKPAKRIALVIVVAIVVLWLPLIVLSALEGTLTGTKVAQPLMRDIVPHVRLLLAIPLLLAAGLVVDPRVSGAIRYLRSSGAVPPSERPAYDAEGAWLQSARDSAWPDIIIILLAYAVTWSLKPGYGESAFEAARTTWMWSEHGREVDYTPAGWWYLLVSGPLFQFILFRWVWRFLLWATYLFRVSRLPLELRPGHPDLAGGIGYLGFAQQSFTAVFFAVATVFASTVAHDILSEGATFEGSQLEIAYLTVLMVVVLYAPLFAFTPKLVRARDEGLQKYGVLGHELIDEFRDAWVDDPERRDAKALLSSNAPSATADYAATYDDVRSMRGVPLTLRNVLTVTVILLVPFVPLALTQFTIEQLLERLIQVLG